MEDIELKPCPFCGASAKVYTGTTGYIPHDGKAYIVCTVCRASTGVFTDTNNDGRFIFEAVKAWNCRVLDKEKDPCSAGTKQESKA